jgi:hypothetical protein
MIDQFLHWAAEARGLAQVLWWFGGSWLAGQILMARTGVVRSSSFEFFPNGTRRDEFRKLRELLKTAKSVRMILVGGSGLITSQPNVSNIKAVLFPHPASESLAKYSRTVGDAGLGSKIISTTRYLMERGVVVRWYSDPIGNSIIIADHGRASAWAQIETVLPFAAQIDRPCVVVHQKAYDELIESISNTFEKMFVTSDPPDPTYLLQA